MKAEPAADAAANAATRPWRWREREWVWIAATVIVLSLVFSVWPGIDLWVAGLFHDRERGFAGWRWPPVMVVYDTVPWIGRGTALVALLLALLAWKRPGRLIGVRWWRRVLVLGLAMFIGTGVMVNGVFKEGWGRARPNAVAEFGGPAVFTPALRPAKQCRTNCSFVSGHSATGFTFLAVGLLAAPAVRRRWLFIGIAAGLLVGAGRIVQGGHFLSDVLFSGVIVWGCCALLREAWLRLRARRRARRLRAAGLQQ